ncbi:MAG TPA: hypothetical protein VMF61_11840 [Candidatus Acidoferrales bacterium]|nr:hypothetical protein [Candidatus Acidoferrales bacterium]
MSLRSYGACAALLFCCAAGCSAALPPPTQTAPSGAAPASLSRRTVSAGDVFRYAGLLTQTQNGVGSRAAVSQTVTVSATPYPYASEPGALDYGSVQTAHGDAPATWHAEAWRGDGPSAGGVVPQLLYGSRIEQNATTSIYRYPVPPVTGEQPQRNGAGWSNGARLSYARYGADGTQTHADYDAAGGYTERVRYAAPCGYSGDCELDATVSDSGAARYAGSLLTASGIASIQLGAPVGGTIEVVYVYAGGSAQSLTIPAWFAPSKLYSETDSISTGTPFPANCKVPAKYGASGNVVTRVVRQVDPAAGTLERLEARTYSASSVGAVCSTVTQSLTAYYDYSSGRFGAVPLRRASQSETLTLQSAARRGAQTGDRSLDADSGLAAWTIAARFRERAAGRGWERFGRI